MSRWQFIGIINSLPIGFDTKPPAMCGEMLIAFHEQITYICSAYKLRNVYVKLNTKQCLPSSNNEQGKKAVGNFSSKQVIRFKFKFDPNQTLVYFKIQFNQSNRRVNLFKDTTDH